MIDTYLQMFERRQLPDSYARSYALLSLPASAASADPNAPNLVYPLCAKTHAYPFLSETPMPWTMIASQSSAQKKEKCAEESIQEVSATSKSGTTVILVRMPPLVVWQIDEKSHVAIGHQCPFSRLIALNAGFDDVSNGGGVVGMCVAVCISTGAMPTYLPGVVTATLCDGRWNSCDGNAGDHHRLVATTAVIAPLAAGAACTAHAGVTHWHTSRNLFLLLRPGRLSPMPGTRSPFAFEFSQVSIDRSLVVR